MHFMLDKRYYDILKGTQKLYSAHVNPVAVEL